MDGAKLAEGVKTERAPSGLVIRFGDFHLDRAEGRLRRSDVELPLRAKSFALLRYLAERPNRVISRAELLRGVWGGRSVSQSVVRMSVRDVRRALGDDPLAPRFVETVGHQGYRFVADGAGSPLATPSFVGRSAELAHLHRMFERCAALRRQVVFVTGERGVGKTALLDHFLDEVRRAGLAKIARGQCINLHGSTEPYLPILDMLSRLFGEDDRARAVRVFERWAPSWLRQMAGVVDANAAEALRRRVPSPTHERMLRELANALEVMARNVPMVVALEDLHWSDASTVDLLAYVAQRATPARLLVIGTYRPVEVIAKEQGLRGTVRDLLARRLAVEMAIELLTPADIETYLGRLFAGTPIDSRLADAIQARTDGNPLFLTAIVDHLLERGILSLANGRWRLGSGAEELPPSLAELVALEVEALADDEQNMLAAASVIGIEFDAVSVAAAAGQPQRAVENVCARLAARGQLVRSTGTTTWPDGSFGGTFRFLHALHREALYARLPAAERARLHRAAGERIEVGWADQPAAMAATLASHFERGSDWPRPVRHHAAAVEAAKVRPGATGSTNPSAGCRWPRGC